LRAPQVAELLLPTACDVYSAAAEFVGRRFEQCAGAALRELAQLSAPALADVLTEPLLVSAALLTVPRATDKPQDA
jgi:hypothetical protein